MLGDCETRLKDSEAKHCVSFCCGSKAQSLTKWALLCVNCPAALVTMMWMA